MRTRLRAKESAALASSIYIVARKIDRLPTAFYNEVKEELARYLNLKLSQLWEEQKEPLDPDVAKLLKNAVNATDLFGGADFFIAAIGSAIEVFGKYERVIDFEGNVVRADKLLDDVQHIVTDYAVKQILHDGFGGKISNLTRFYLLWRWNYGEARILFDDARKLAQSCELDLAEEWGKHGFIKKYKEFIHILGPQQRNLKDLKESNELIDVLHHILLLWQHSESDKIIVVLNKSGFGLSDSFYRFTHVAQAISETLPKKSDEKKLLDGFLIGKERIERELKQGSGQTALSEW
jgi:hypothetical protein